MFLFLVFFTSPFITKVPKLSGADEVTVLSHDFNTKVPKLSSSGSSGEEEGR